MKPSDSEAMPVTAASIGQIVETYTPRLRSYIRGQVANREDAEDILQEVFYSLTRATLTDGNEITRVSAWLFRVARNAVLNLWRQRSGNARPVLDAASIDSACESLSDMLFSPDAAGPESTYLRKLVWQELDDALAQLPPEQSEVFCLTEFDGIPVKEISARTGVPVATLLSRKHYAVKHLRLRLKGLYEDIMIY